jgi:hypothetical protein
MRTFTSWSTACIPTRFARGNVGKIVPSSSVYCAPRSRPWDFAPYLVAHISSTTNNAANAKGAHAANVQNRTPHPKNYLLKVKAHLPEYHAARTWDDLEARLHSAGLRLERKGQGLVVTDGENDVKASRIGRDLSLRRLEERFGISYAEHGEQSMQGALGRTEGDVTNGAGRGHERVSAAVAEVAEAVRTLERLDALRRERSELSKETSSIRERLHAIDRETQHAVRASKALTTDFARVYSDPDAAHARFIERAQKSGSEAVRTLHETHETFGDLIAVERKRALGLMIETDDSSARQHAGRCDSKRSRRISNCSSRCCIGHARDLCRVVWCGSNGIRSRTCA